MYAMNIVSPEGRGARGLSRWVQKPRLSLAVTGGSDGVLCNISFVLSGTSILVTTFFVSNRHCISLWLGYDPFHMC